MSVPRTGPAADDSRVLISPKGTAGTRPIRVLRRQAGISQQRLAELAKCSVAMVQLLEGGYEPAESRVLERIASVLNDSDPVTTPGRVSQLRGSTPDDGRA